MPDQTEKFPTPAEIVAFMQIVGQQAPKSTLTVTGIGQGGSASSSGNTGTYVPPTDTVNWDWYQIPKHPPACPNCGYCPHCGRSNTPFQPQWPYYPQITWCKSE